jgi:hypothetical protein
MKQVTKDRINRLSKFMAPFCEKCPSGEEFRCCDKMFCSFVEEELHQQVNKPNVGGIPFMSSLGCVLDPHLRKKCTGFCCEDLLKDRSFRREYEKRIIKINEDPEAKVPMARY